MKDKIKKAFEKTYDVEDCIYDEERDCYRLKDDPFYYNPESYNVAKQFDAFESGYKAGKEDQ